MLNIIFYPCVSWSFACLVLIFLYQFKYKIIIYVKALLNGIREILHALCPVLENLVQLCVIVHKEQLLSFSLEYTRARELLIKGPRNKKKSRLLAMRNCICTFHLFLKDGNINTVSKHTGRVDGPSSKIKAERQHNNQVTSFPIYIFKIWLLF